MAVCCGLLVDRAAKIQHLDDACRTQVKVLADHFHNLLLRNLSGSEGVYVDGGRLCDTDCIGELNLHAVCIAGCNQVLRNIACRICRRAVYLGAVLAGEGSAAVTANSAVGVNNDLTAGQTCITVRSADDKASGRVDVNLGVSVHHGRIHNCIDDILADVLMDLLLCYLLVMLRGDNDCLQTNRLVVLVILNGYLRLSVCAKISKRSVLSHFRKLSGQLVCKVDGIRHILRCLVRCIAEHHALIAGTDGLDLFVRHAALSCLECLVNTHGNIRGLLIHCHKNSAGICIKALGGIVIADLTDGVADNLLIVNDSLCRDLTGNQCKAGAHCGLAGNTAHGILSHAGIQNRIADCVADFVGMSFGYRLRCKNILLHFRTSFVLKVS